LKSQTKESKSMKQNKNHCVKIILSVGAIACVVALAGCAGTRSTQGGGGGVPADYKGKPWQDKAQVIPGKIHAAFYDLGGEGVAYHDTDPEINRGSGELNQRPEQQMPESSPYYWNFRKNEGVDISYTKDFADFNHHQNMVNPPTNQFYIGWAADGEWCNYTVDVKKAGTYKIIALYSNGANLFKFSINHKPACECKFPVSTGSMHKWNKAKVGTITFSEAGLQLLTLYYNKGNNFAYFEFEAMDSSAAGSKASTTAPGK